MSSVNDDDRLTHPTKLPIEYKSFITKCGGSKTKSLITLTDLNLLVKSMATIVETAQKPRQLALVPLTSCNRLPGRFPWSN